MNTTNDTIPLYSNSNSTEAFFPSQTLHFLIAINVAVGITCLLSFVGAGAIILSFLCFRELRTTSRFLLFNLSIADAIVAVSNIVGATSSYQFIGINQTHHSPTTPCIFSATAGLYATDSSILWTIAVMLYICLLTCCRRSVIVVVDRLTVVVLMVICWCLPLVVVIVYSVKGYFGFEPGFSPGFCTIVNINNERMHSHAIIAILGYDVFLFIAFITLPLLSVIFVCQFKCKVSTAFQTYLLLCSETQETYT